MESVSSIERLDIRSTCAKDFRRRFRVRGRPVILANGFVNVPEWNVAYLASMLDDRKYAVRYYGREHFERAKSEWSRYCELRQYTFNEYASLLADGKAHREHIYFAKIPIDDTAAGSAIREKMDVIGERTGMRRFRGCNLCVWLGPGDHTEPLHFDLGDGTLIQLKGTKKVTLFPPAATAGLYPFPLTGSPIKPWFSQVDIARPDFRRFPGLEQALKQRLDVKLEVGDALFIPAFWWHEVSAAADDYVCSVNQFWKVEPRWRSLVHGRRALALSVMLNMPERAATALGNALRALPDIGA
jgi:hypothetical protein